MPAVNTYHTLNDYRISVEPVYETGGSFSKLGAGALIVAIFLGVGAYFFYSTQHRDADTSPASNDMNYQAPAAPDSATPADTVDQAALPDAPNAATASPTTDMDTAHAAAQESAMDRIATESKSNISSTQLAQRAKPSTKALNKSTSDSTSLTGNAATATSEMTQPAPVSSEPAATDKAAGTAQDPVANKADAPADAVPDAAIERSVGG